MRARLIELLRNSPKTDTVYGDIKLPEPVQTLRTIADHLISEGVIVPPVKVGQTVYRPIITSKGEPAIWEIIVTSISIYIENGVSPNSYVIGHLKHTPCGESADFREFGKTVFLTREEAEKALAERSKNGT